MVYCLCLASIVRNHVGNLEFT